MIRESLGYGSLVSLRSPARFPLREVLRQMKVLYKDQFKVIIRADADLPFNMVEPVLIECANASATNIFFTTQKGEATEPAPAP